MEHPAEKWMVCVPLEKAFLCGHDEDQIEIAVSVLCAAGERSKDDCFLDAAFCIERG